MVANLSTQDRRSGARLVLSITALLAGLPLPGAPVPSSPPRLAAELAATTQALNASIDRWGGKGSPPRDVTLLALYQQRIQRTLVRDPDLSRAVIARLPGTLGSRIASEVVAMRGLRRLATPQPLSRFRTRRPAPPEALRHWYGEAERRFGVGWHVLAAVNYVESAFGKLGNASVAGAQGPMQFLPATWRAYGLGGDINDPRDAILGAANYLRASGAPNDLRRALYAYNHSGAYVDAILRYSRRIAGDPRAFPTYYSRQVFVLTPSGDRRLTGPKP